MCDGRFSSLQYRIISSTPSPVQHVFRCFELLADSPKHINEYILYNVKKKDAKVFHYYSSLLRGRSDEHKGRRRRQERNVARLGRSSSILIYISN